jgi:hypothetical protein
MIFLAVDSARLKAGLSFGGFTPTNHVQDSVTEQR